MLELDQIVYYNDSGFILKCKVVEITIKKTKTIKKDDISEREDIYYGGSILDISKSKYFVKNELTETLKGLMESVKEKGQSWFLTNLYPLGSSFEYVNVDFDKYLRDINFNRETK